jgi:ATP-dependent RNA helicase DDX19/DBP5
MTPGVQHVLFSATFPDEVQDFADDFAPEANKIFLKREELSVEAIKQLYLQCENEEQKYEALSNLYDCMSIGQSIVFCKVGKASSLTDLRGKTPRTKLRRG